MKGKPSILIVGAGAIGASMAIILQKKGYEPHLVVKYPELKELSETKGLKLTGHNGNYQLNVKAFMTSDLQDVRYDLILIATKANDMEEATRYSLPFMHSESLIISLQNGICEDTMAEIAGRKRVIGCVVGWGATMKDYGNYEMTSGGEFIIGSIEKIPGDKLIAIKEVFSNIVPTYISENIYSDLYSKLVVNSCITTLGAISGIRLGDMLRRKKFRNIFIAIVEEAIKVADKAGIYVKPYAKKIDYYRFLKNKNVYGQLKRHFIITMVGLKYRKLKSSSLQSLERGKKTEVNFFNGYIVERARELDVPVPVNDKLTQMLREIEEGKRKIGMENFKDPFFTIF